MIQVNVQMTVTWTTEQLFCVAEMETFTDEEIISDVCDYLRGKFPLESAELSNDDIMSTVVTDWSYSIIG